MGEPAGILQLTDENGHAVDGVYYRKTSTPKGTMTHYFTRNLEPGHRFHAHELCIEEGGAQFRVMNPTECHLATALCCKLTRLFVKNGSQVFFLANDDSSVVTISHLSDIVGTDGTVFVAVKHIHGDKFDKLFNLRSNVVYVDGANTTNPGQKSMEYLQLHPRFTGSIDVLYSDVGTDDQVQWLFDHASVLLENGGHFVAFFKVKKAALTSNLDVVCPPFYYLKHEMKKLDNLGFNRFKSNDFGSYDRSWACVVGEFKGTTPEVIPTGSSSASSATVDP